MFPFITGAAVSTFHHIIHSGFPHSDQCQFGNTAVHLMIGPDTETEVLPILIHRIEITFCILLIQNFTIFTQFGFEFAETTAEMVDLDFECVHNFRRFLHGTMDHTSIFVCNGENQFPGLFGVPQLQFTPDGFARLPAVFCKFERCYPVGCFYIAGRIIIINHISFCIQQTVQDLCCTAGQIGGNQIIIFHGCSHRVAEQDFSFRIVNDGFQFPVLDRLFQLNSIIRCGYNLIIFRLGQH